MLAFSMLLEESTRLDLDLRGSTCGRSCMYCLLIYPRPGQNLTITLNLTLKNSPKPQPNP